MRLKSNTLSKLTNVMLGAAWGIALIGALSAFSSFLKINLFVAALSSLVGAMPGLMIVLFVEYLFLKSEKMAEMQKQTRVIEKILKTISKNE